MSAPQRERDAEFDAEFDADFPLTNAMADGRTPAVVVEHRRGGKTFDGVLRDAFLAGVLFAEGPESELSVNEGFAAWKRRQLP